MWCHIMLILQLIILMTAMLVSFPLSLVVENMKMSQNFSFSSYHNNKLQLHDKNISTQKVDNSNLSWIMIKPKIIVFCCFSPYHAVQKGNQGAGHNYTCISVYSVMQTLYSGYMNVSSFKNVVWLRFAIELSFTWP